MPCLMLVLDGLQDVAYSALGGQTPYDWGKGKAFRAIEKDSARGSLATTPTGFEPDTLTCILTLLGVAEGDIPSGRSYLEALALGVPVKDSDIVLRCNFVKVTADGVLEDPTCTPPDAVAEALKAAVAAQHGHSITQVGPYKSLQVIADDGVFLQGMRTFPPHNYAGKPFALLLPTGNSLADSLAAFSRRQLAIHAPYTVFNWAQSSAGGLPQFSALHGGISGAMVSATLAPMGCAVAMGMECPKIPGATGDTDTDLSAKLEAALALLARHDFVMLHIGGPDEATHRQDAAEKGEFVRRLDEELVTPLLERCPDGTRVMLTCDHVALCTTGGHTSEPVDFWLYEKGAALSANVGVRDGKDAVAIAME